MKDRAGNNAIEYMFFPLAAPGAGGMSSDALVEADGGGNNRVQCDRRREAVLVWMSGLDAPVETDTAGSGSCFLKLNNAPEPLWATRAAGGTATEYIFSLAVPETDDMSSEAMLGTDLTSDNATEHSFFAGKRVARREASGAVFYCFADHLGSSRVVTNATGTILDDSDFYPFGGERAVAPGAGSSAGTPQGVRHPFGSERVVAAGSGNAYKFTGKERDPESALDYFAAWYYGSSLGRFMSADPLGGHLEDPQSLNRYAYVRNNPINLTDPTGLDFWLKGGDACGKNGITCDKKGFVMDDKGNRVLIGNVQLRDPNSKITATFDSKGVHITTAQGTFIGQFAPGAADTRIEGSGEFKGLHAVFNSDCGGTCLAKGSLFGKREQIEALLPQLEENPGIDVINILHPWSTQYRGGNELGPDAHLSYREKPLPNGGYEFHIDTRYPYGNVSGFFEHTVSVLKTIWNFFTGRQDPPPPKDIPIASVPQEREP